MQLTSNVFLNLLKTLDLSQGFSKPTPSSSSNSLSVNSLNETTASLDNTASNFHDAESLAEATILLANQSVSDPCHVDVYHSSTFKNEVFPPYNKAASMVYRYRQQQSVNLGAWFVQESWMTPSLFACASGSKSSELDVASGWGSIQNARFVLERHWDSFIEQADFDYLAMIGINTVRLPIGFWSLGSAFCKETAFDSVSDVYKYAWPRVVHAINMANNAGLGVLVDLHGAVGSQNGQSHSGISDGKTQLFGNKSNIDKTNAALVYLMQQLVNVTNVVGIQILNEPKNDPSLETFYNNTITSMRAVSDSAASFPLYIHDGFDLNRFSNFISKRTDFIVQDHHSYFVFTPSDSAESATRHTVDIAGSIADSLYTASERQRRNIVVDEFSCALSPDSLAHEIDPKEAQRLFCTGQMEMYANHSAGWSFWAYMKEGCNSDPGWCFKAAVNTCLPATFFSFGEPSKFSSQKNGSFADTDTFAELFPSDTLPDIDLRQKLSVNLFVNEGSQASQSASAFDVLGDQQDLTKRNSANNTTNKKALTKGYSDGFFTAKIFASHGVSKLGFTGQYLLDSVAALGHEVLPRGSENAYMAAFMHGLLEAEAMIKSLVT